MRLHAVIIQLKQHFRMELLESDQTTFARIRGEDLKLCSCECGMNADEMEKTIIRKMKDV